MLSEKLKKLRTTNTKLTQAEFAKKIDVARTTYAMYEQGNREPDYNTLQRIADFYEVTTDYLLGREAPAAPNALPELTAKEERDIAKKLEDILNDLDGESSLAFDGEPLDDTTRELVRAQIESNLRLAKQLAKKKFTPKKYRE